MSNLLTADEVDILEQISRSGKPMHARRARLLLLADQGVNSREIGTQVSLSDRQVRHWVSAFRERRLDVFPTKVVAAIGPGGSTSRPVGPEEGLARDELEGDRPEEFVLSAGVPNVEITVAEMCERYAVNLDHAQHVARTATTLFDITQRIHRIPPEQRGLLETSALLHDVGLTFYPKQHHTAGRDLVLQHRITDLTEQEQQIVACITALHRKRFRSRRLSQEPSFLALPEEARAVTLALAAIIRVADGLDDSLSQTSSLAVDRTQIEAPGPRIALPVTGPSAMDDAARAQRKADLWSHLFESQLDFVPVDPIAPPATQTGDQEAVWATILAIGTDIQPDDAMSEAGRKVLRLHFARMLEHEAGTRLGTDIEELHDMRVATRRMRSAFDVFAPYFDPKVLQPFVKRLRRIGRALGRVRDLDVFMEKAQRYLKDIPDNQDINLDSLLDAWRSQRETARERMIETLDGKVYRRFVEEFGAFVTTPGAGALVRPAGRPAANQVYQVVPTLVYRRYEVVRSYEPLLDDAPLDILHALRVDFKRLRYTLEFFRDVLGPEVGAVVKEVVAVQDHLGDLNDADVACSLLIEFLGQWSRSERRDRVDISGVVQYLLTTQTELHGWVASFPGVWLNFNRAELRRSLALAVAAL
ncbi:MAG: CHAD domain-containing protein [Chloroflexi bacterium]|nr:CHAD domain-containing protein [Chloroflexota bacterium]